MVSEVNVQAGGAPLHSSPNQPAELSTCMAPCSRVQPRRPQASHLPAAEHHAEQRSNPTHRQPTSTLTGDALVDLSWVHAAHRQGPLLGAVLQGVLEGNSLLLLLCMAAAHVRPHGPCLVVQAPAGQEAAKRVVPCQGCIGGIPQHAG